MSQAAGLVYQRAPEFATFDANEPLLDDEKLASLSTVPLLLTAPTRTHVIRLAHRVHRNGLGVAAPFVETRANTLPTSTIDVLQQRCAALFCRAAGGSLVLMDVESMPSLVQEPMLVLLCEQQETRDAAKRVRLISGTTVPLFERVVAGTFSADLFYRLNVIHLVMAAPPARRQPFAAT